MDPHERWKSIAPATDEPGQHRAAPDPKKKRSAVPVACIPCRSGKARCDGTRPRCVRCANNDLRCQYDVPEGVSRAERMKIIKRDGLSSRLEESERIINALRSGSDDEASNILARLRLGETVEDVTSFLQANVTSDRTSRTSSLGPWEASSSPSNGLGFEPIQAQNDRKKTTPYRREFDPALTLSAERRASVPSSSGLSPVHASSGKQKQQLEVSQVKEQPFLSLLFNREDCLLPASDDDDDYDMRDNSGTDHDAKLDPRLLNESPGLEVEAGTVISPTYTSGIPSPQKYDATRSIHGKHRGSRQSIVDAVRVHPNVDFSSPSFPTWAMMIVNTRSDPGSLKHAFTNIHREAMVFSETVGSTQTIIEIHPNIAALYDEDAFFKSGMISQWAASVVHSLQLSGKTFTNFATMYLFWYVIRWMISPTPETYESIPEWLRPTPNQLFMPHISVLDFIPWPAFRELAVQLPAMQERMVWLIIMMTTIRCDWWHTLEEALFQHNETGLVDLSPLGKDMMRELSNWSVGPSFRGYVSNADLYVRIRTED